jgi:alpha-amylase/alpha-mannosidase (GH57 family)
MEKYVCIHGHFYQPPRENPWLEAIEVQDSAYPYRDWNERITAESYSPNTAARILGDNSTVIDIVNNYSKISFNFGPTLLSWMEVNTPEVYQAILDADKISQKNFSGHGSAIAQNYGHTIMPLNNIRDKETQIIWGIEDFRHRFGREPEGMWLAETAVDIETLELLAKFDIKFTILAPRQALRVRHKKSKNWTDVHNDSIDPKKAYFCDLPSGKKINLFFYDGPISQELAFGNLLKSGENLANRLVDTFNPDDKSAQIANIATDGETYGHHQKHGDMALAYCLHYYRVK